MSREPLQRASDLLTEASDAASGERADRLQSQAKTFADFATADRGPDHGQLARYEGKLKDIQDGATDAVTETIDGAIDAIHAYRETIEGV